MAKKQPLTPKATLTSATAQIHREVDVLALEDNLVAYRIIYQVDLEGEVPANLASRYSRHTEEGLARPKAVRDFLSDKASSIKPVQNLHLMPAGFRDHAQQVGYVDACEKFSKEAVDGSGLFDRFAAGGTSLEDLVISDYSSHMLFDRHGEVLPTALYFDYMNGHIRNGAYHLDKVIDILRNDPRVTAIEERRRNNTDVLDKKDWKPQSVPYYNVSKGCSTHVSFRFAPTLDDMRRLWAQMKSYGSKYPSTENYRAVFDLDLLGLRAGNAAKYPDFHGDDAYNSSDDNDDE